MCDAVDETLFMTKKTSISTNERKCMKCEECAVVLIRIDDAFCRNCFISYMTHKFRSAIGKSRLILFDEKVLLAYSGGHSSCAMLHLVQQGFLEHVHKKLRFFPQILYIDEGAVTNQTLSERTSRRQEIVSKLHSTGIPFDIVSLERVMNLGDGQKIINEPTDLTDSNKDNGFESKKEGDSRTTGGSQQSSTKTGDPRIMGDSETMEGTQQSSTKKDNSGTLTGCGCINDLSTGVASLSINGLAEKLRKLIESAKTLTTKEDLLCRLRQQLLVEVARQRACTKIMLADSGTLVSVRILANVAQGRGAALPFDTGFSDSRYGDIAFVRPLKEFTKKEIILYNQFHNMQSMFVPSLTTKAGTGASINLLTEEFVNGLQEDFPSTVSTICRTGEKLGTNNNSSQDKCLICRASLDTSVPPASALHATNFSLSLSKTCKDKASRPSSADPKQCCGEGDGSCNSSKTNNISMDDIESLLCYGCRVTIRDVSDINLFPEHLITEVEKTIRRSKMKEEIADFLLPDD